MSPAGPGWFEGIGWGVVRVDGSDGIDLLHRLSTNDLVGIRPGECRSTVLTTEKGRIVDLLHVVPLEARSLLLIASPGNGGRVIQWLEKFTIREESSYSDLTSSITVSCVVGSKEVTRAFNGTGVHVERGSAVKVKERGRDVIAFRPGGVPFDIGFVCPLDRTGGHLLEGAADGAQGGLEGDRGNDQFEDARIVEGVPLAPAELSEEWNPYDAGLRGVISFTKGCFVGQEVITRMETYQKVRRGLVKLDLDTFPNRDDNRVLFKKDVQIGLVTSASPLMHGLNYRALAIIRLEEIGRGDVLRLGFGGGEGRVVEMLGEGGTRWV